MLKRYFSVITLFTVLMVVLLMFFFITLASRQPPPIKQAVLIRTGLGAVALFFLDVLLKQILKLKPVWLWLIQIFLLLVAVYIWIIS